MPKLENINKFVQNTIGGWEGNSIFTAAHGSSLSVYANGTYNNGNVSGLIGTGYIGNNRSLTVTTQPATRVRRARKSSQPSRRSGARQRPDPERRLRTGC